MNKYIKKTIIIFIIAIVAIILSFFIIKHLKNKQQINDIVEVYQNEDLQNKLEDKSVSEDKMLLEIDGEKVVGVIFIEKIKFQGEIYKGTSLETLSKGVGHFDNSPYFDGNVCLAAHNTAGFWAKLHTLQEGDEITYVSFLGTRKYQVINITEINETDWSLLGNTEKNILTLITCVKEKPSKRLCVQALEVD